MYKKYFGFKKNIINNFQIIFCLSGMTVSAGTGIYLIRARTFAGPFFRGYYQVMSPGR